MLKAFKIIRIETIRLILLAALLAMMAPFVKLIMIYLHFMNNTTYHYINDFILWFAKEYQIHQNINLWSKILSQLFWPFIITIIIDRVYSKIRKKKFDHNYLCALLLWLIFNGSSIILQ